MSFVPPVYVPNKEVKMAHSIPRLNYETFAFTTHAADENSFLINADTMDLFTDPTNLLSSESAFPAEKNYLVGLVSLPLCLVVLGVASVIIFQLILFLRCCCKCLKCAPHEDEVRAQSPKVIKSRNRVVWGFWLFLILMVAADGWLYFGDQELDKGADRIIQASKNLKNIFTSMIDETSNMITQLAVLTGVIKNISNGGCNSGSFPQNAQAALNAAQSAIDVMSGAFSTLNGIMEPVPGFLDSAVDYTDKYGKEMKTLYLYYLFGFVLAIALLFLCGSCYSSKYLLFLTTFIGELVVLFATLIGGFVMIIITIYADFCLNPAGNLSAAIPGQSSKDMVTFYSTCVGTDPFDTPLTDASSGVSTFQTEFITLIHELENPGGVCPASYEIDINSACSSIIASLAEVNGQTNCEPVYDVYDKFLNQGICDNTFAGLFNVWLSVCGASISLYFLMCFSSVMWQYFGDAWKLRPVNGHTGEHMNLVGTHMAPVAPAAADHGAHHPTNGFRQEYTFTATSPNAPVLTRRDIEMI